MGPLIHHRFDTLRATHPEIPTLDEALAVLADLTVNVEIKNSPMEPDHDPEHRMAAYVAHWVAQHDIRDRVIVTSFNTETAIAVRRADAALTTGQLLSTGTDPLAAIEAVADAGHTWLAPFVGDVVDNAPGVIAAAHAAGIRVAVWTVDDPSHIGLLADAGVDALISNDPRAALRVLG
jgi:glycerophosphoryl diester phosphodiesterase